jgi:hypothetical protein
MWSQATWQYVFVMKSDRSSIVILFTLLTLATI